MKNLKKLALLSLSSLALASCSGPTNASISFSHDDKNPTDKPSTYAKLDDDAVYDLALKEYENVLLDAKKENDDNIRYVKYALAEANLLDSAVFASTYTRGGAYAMTRVAYHTVPFVYWGNDADRYEKTVIVKPNASGNNFITSGDRAELKEAWDKAHASGKESDYNPKKILEGKGYEIADSYQTTFNEDPATLDALNTYRQNDTEVIMQGLEGLYKYDLVGVRQPAMAVGEPKVSDDGLVYTFKIRSDAKWYTADGKEYGKVTADDFVAGFEHMLDCQAGLEYLADGIKGATDYYSESGTPASFAATVGFKALDENTLEITLNKAESFFLTRLTYSCFMPLNRAFFESKGGVFGVDAFAEKQTSEDYKYGNVDDISSILYNSAYIAKNIVSQSVMEYKLNDAYYDAKNVTTKNIKWVYDDGSNPKAVYDAAVKGDYLGVTLGAASGLLKLAKDDGNFAKYNYVSEGDATTFFGGYNLNRNTFSYGSLNSNKTEQEKIDYRYAIQFPNFRRALQQAWDRVTWNAVSVGEECAPFSIRNTYTPPTFVSLSSAVKVGDKTFEKGTSYGDMVEYFLEAYFGRKINLDDGQDGWYNPEQARAYLAQAKKDMGDNWSSPIKIEVLYYANSPSQTAQVQAYKKSIEEALNTDTEKNVEVVPIGATTTKDYYYASYYAAAGEDCCYDLYYGSGWGPDFGDPSTYLDTFLSNVAGGMTKVIGLY